MFDSEILIILALIALNSFFAMSELAIVSASKPLLRQMAKKGSKSAKIALQLAEDSGSFLSAVQVGITLIGILAGAYGGATIAEKLQYQLNDIAWINPHGDTLAVALVVTVITYCSVVIGELIPKQIALSNPEKFALIAARPMRLMLIICKPIVTILDISSEFLMKILGISNIEGKITEDEVRAVVAEGMEHGAIAKTEHEMFNRIIMLAERDLKSIMTPRSQITFIDVNDSLDVIRKKVHQGGHSRYPVIDGGEEKIIGLVQSKRLLDLILSSDDLSIKSIIEEVKFLPESTNCLNALEIFRTRNIHLIMVLDEYGLVEGLITASDMLEAIVGALPANYDSKSEVMIITREDGSWLVDGRAPLEEIYLTIGIEEMREIEDFETLSGFLISEFNKDNLKIEGPKEGDIIERYGYRFEVVDKDERVIDKVLISNFAHANF